MIGQVLNDRYKVQEEIASQAGRLTLLARDLETQELVLVKVISFSSDMEWNDFRVFEQRAETLQALSHPCIPKYLDHFELNSQNFRGFALVQSYIKAISLESHLNAGRNFSEAEVTQIATAILEILIYLHERQPAIIHCDIKPSNILLGARSAHSVGQVYLVDFAFVQNLVTTEVRTMPMVRTYGYMAPEQIGNRAVPASDLYSLGAILIYLVTRTHPHSDTQIQFEQVENISPDFANWLTWMIQPSLERRLNSANRALQLLNQEQNQDSRPADSQVLLQNPINSCNSLIPPQGFSLNLGALLITLYMLFVNLSLLVVTLLVFSLIPHHPEGFIFLVLLVPCWYLCLPTMIWTFLAIFN